MYNGKRILAVIPARKGSKRLPRKNIRKLCGKPLIAHTIEAAKASRYIDEMIVSTDCPEIATIAGRCGASVPFTRPARLATDKAKTVDVLLHALAWYARKGLLYDIIVLLQPTSPLRNATDIDTSIRLLFRKRASAIVSVCRAEHHPSWIHVLPKSGSMKGFMKRGGPVTGADHYRLNGAVYVTYANALKMMNSFYGSRTFAYVMPGERSIDIDCGLDLEFAEYLANKGPRKA